MSLNRWRSVRLATLYGIVDEFSPVLVHKIFEERINLEHNDRPSQSRFLAITISFESANEIQLASAAGINVKNGKGHSPLHIAVLKYNAIIIKNQLSNRSDIEHINMIGDSFLMYGLRRCPEHFTSLTVCEKLLRQGADVNIRNNTGQTPLHFAFMLGHFYEAHLLLEWGGSMLIADNYGQTPLDIAAPNQSDIIICHIVTMTSANLPLHFHYEFTIPEQLILHQKACLEELERIKSIEFGRFSLYDVLLEHGDPVFLSNKEREEIDSLLYQNDFPIYCELLRARFEKSKHKLLLLNLAQPCLKMVLPVILPNEIVREILSYMCNEDLANIIKV